MSDPITSDNAYDERCSGEISKFLADYVQPQTRKRYADAAALARKDCEALLKGLSVKGSVQCRVKQDDSLQKKINDLAQNPESDFREYVANGGVITNREEMSDLAGVRIGLYFPRDVFRVATEIERHFQLKHSYGTVTGGRKFANEKKLDLQEHMQPPLIDQDNDRWAHSGYKSWQLVVGWKNPPVSGPTSLRVEIQIGTVISQAWAEIQHDIIYKKPAYVRATPSMKRMIDAVNGLAITTEIILEELVRSEHQAMKEAKDLDRQPLKDGRELFDWFQTEYLESMRPGEQARWRQSGDVLWSTDRVITLCKISERKEDGPEAMARIKVVPCRGVFRKLIEEKGLLHAEPKKGEKLDIGELLLGLFGYGVGPPVAGNVPCLTWLATGKPVLPVKINRPWNR